MLKFNPPHPDSQHFEQDTWLEPESLCFPNGGFTRRARAKMPDGKLLIFRAGLCDTFFSIPVKGHDGFLATDDDDVLTFYPHRREGEEEDEN